jgi:hypothetical protein
MYHHKIYVQNIIFTFHELVYDLRTVKGINLIKYTTNNLVAMDMFTNENVLQNSK